MKSTILAFPCRPSRAGKMKNLLRKSTGKRANRHRQAIVQKSGNRLVIPLSYLDDILKGVTGKDLISSLATNDDLEIARRALRELIESHDQRVSTGRSMCQTTFGSRSKSSRSTLDLVMGRSEQPGGLGRIMGLVAWGEKPIE